MMDPRLYVSGGNAQRSCGTTSDIAPVYVFSYANGRLSDKPVAEWLDSLPANETLLDRVGDASEEEPSSMRPIVARSDARALSASLMLPPAR